MSIQETKTLFTGRKFRERKLQETLEGSGEEDTSGGKKKTMTRNQIAKRREQ